MIMTVIGIGGGSGSGKSIIVDKLKDEFGDDLAVLHHSNYYWNQNNVPLEIRKKGNYDYPEALETGLLAEHLMNLRSGKAVNSPVYDYSQYTRSEQVVFVNPSKIILVEGSFVLADSRIRDLLDVKVYIDTDADERFFNRVVRDEKEFGRKLRDVVETYLTTVKQMHNLHVEPTRKLADLVINGGGKNQKAVEILKCYIRGILEEQNF